MFKSESYKKGDCCHSSDCAWLTYSTEEEPCWGETRVIDEDFNAGDMGSWIHACQGHDYIDNGKYIKETK